MYKMNAILSCCKFKELNRENRFGRREWVGTMELMEQKICAIISTVLIERPLR